MSEGCKPCSPSCQFFRCGQKQMIFRSRIPWCRFAEEECDPKSCKYAYCIKEKLLPSGICGLTLRQRRVEVPPPEEIRPVRLSGKLAQKIRERELF
jgi:hypothetical protein